MPNVFVECNFLLPCTPRALLGTATVVQTVLTVAGLLVNVYVLVQLTRIVIDKPQLYQASTKERIRQQMSQTIQAVLMLTMCISDIIYTTVILITTILRHSALRKEFSVGLNSILCRSLVFTVNTAAALGFVIARSKSDFYRSMWLWLAMSTQRYIALLHSHRYRNRTLLVRPVFVVTVLVIVICSGRL